MPAGEAASVTPAPAALGWLDVALAFLVGLIARLLHLGHKPFWLDEVFTLHRIQLGAGGLIADSLSNRHLPFYFLLLRWCVRLGHGAIALRLPSALFGALSVVVVYDLARRVGGPARGRVAGIAAALLMALSPQQVQYGQEARAYTLASLLVLAALWGLVRLARHYTAPIQDRRPAGRVIAWTAYTLGTAAALDVLGDTAPWLLVAAIFFALLWRAARADRAAILRGWAVANVVILAATLPFYALMLRFASGGMLRHFNWVPPLSWHGVWVSVASTYLMRASAVTHLDLLPAKAPALALLVALLAAAGVGHLWRRLDGAALLLAVAVLPLLLLVISLGQPMLVPRYLLWSAGPFFVLAGSGAALLPRALVPATLSVVGLLACANLDLLYQAETKPRWDLATSQLARDVRDRDTILTSDPNGPDMLRALQPPHRPAIAPGAVITPELGVAVARWKQGGRVFAVHGRSALGVREQLDAFRARLAALGAPAREIPVGQELTILTFASRCDAAALPAEGCP